MGTRLQDPPPALKRVKKVNPKKLPQYVYSRKQDEVSHALPAKKQPFSPTPKWQLVQPTRVLPPREHQTEYTLQTEDTAPVNDHFFNDSVKPLIAAFAQFKDRHPEAMPMEDRIRSLSPLLQDDVITGSRLRQEKDEEIRRRRQQQLLEHDSVARQGSVACRMVGEEGQYAKYAFPEVIDDDTTINAFYVDDPEDLEFEFGSLEYKNAAPFRALVNKTREAFLQRGNAIEMLAADAPRVKPARVFSRAEMTIFRYPPKPGEELCMMRSQCRFAVGDSKKGYVGKVFLIDGERPQVNGKEIGLCIDCLLSNYMIMLNQNVAAKRQPVHPFNAFTVLCGPGEYNGECMMRTEVNNCPTGISGFVPGFATNKREYLDLPSNEHTIGIEHPYYYAEVGMDFR